MNKEQLYIQGKDESDDDFVVRIEKEEKEYMTSLPKPTIIERIGFVIIIMISCFRVYILRKPPY